MNRADNPNRVFYSHPVKAKPCYTPLSPTEWKAIELFDELTNLAQDYLLLHFHIRFEFEFWGWVQEFRLGIFRPVLVDEDHSETEWFDGLQKIADLAEESQTWWLFQGPHVAISLNDWQTLYKLYLNDSLNYFELRNMYRQYGFSVDEEPASGWLPVHKGVFGW